MKSVSEILHRTPWWVLLLSGVATLAGLAFFVTPYHIIQYQDDGRTVEESRAIKREVDNTFVENALNLGRGVVKGMLARTTDPERRAELQDALTGLDEARSELRLADTEVLRAKREALDSARQSARSVREAVTRATELVLKDSGPEAQAQLREIEKSLRAAENAERQAARDLKRAERGRTFSIGPKPSGKPMLEIEIPPRPEQPVIPDPPSPPSDVETATVPAPPLAPEVANRIRRGVTGDMYRIGIGAVLILVLVPLFIVAIVIKFFADRSRASLKVADAKRKEAEYHRMSQQVTEAKLSALQAQVEPHFLYNTLASVQALTEVDPARANEMTGHLIQYLRNALPKMRESVSTVGQEVELVRAYLSILKMRMGERLAFSIDVPPELLAMPFPPLMLPSLVENAIKHGLEPQREGGSVHIAASAADGTLRMVVTDTGRGFSDSPGAGVGLANIRERLAALYGGTARLTMQAGEPRGVIATIEVPAEGTRSQGGTFGRGPQAAPASAAATTLPPSLAPLQVPAAEGFWGRAWEILGRVERGWRVALYYFFLVMVGVAAVAAVGLLIAAVAGVVPVQIGDGVVAGPLRIFVALGVAVVAWLVVSAALAIVTLVLYGLGFFIFALAIFVVIVVILAMSPILAPLALLGFAVWWMARRRKAPASAG